MVYQYTPILRWKRGEQRGLKSVSSASVKDVRPLIIVDAETFEDQPETSTKEGVPASFIFKDAVYKHWGARAFALDASGVQPSSRGVHPLIQTAKLCREIGANLTPATTLGAPAPYEAAVMETTKTDGRGVILKVNLREFTSAAQWVSSWPHALEQTDLIVDLGDQVSVISDLGSALDLAFRNLHLGKRWRTVSIAGTSMPENFGALKQGVHKIDRAEYILWQHLLALKLPYTLHFGDYATVALKPPPSNIRWGYPINVRYTLPNHFLICKGVGTLGETGRDMDEQLIEHAKSIVKHRPRHRLDCWADNTIDEIAAENEKPGNLETWVQIGVSRHIERVRADIP